MKIPEGKDGGLMEEKKLILSEYINYEILALSDKLDTAFACRDTDELKELVSLCKKLLEKYTKPLEIMQIYYDIGTGYSELRAIENSEEYLEHEILNLRKCVNLYYEINIKSAFTENETAIANYICVQAYINLGNAFRITQRHLMALNCFFDAINIDSSFLIAYANLSATLFEFAQIQNNALYLDCFNHAGYHYYEQAMELKNAIQPLETQDGLDAFISNIKDYITEFPNEYLYGFLKKDIELPNLDIVCEEENEYRLSLSLYRVFLNPVEDILPHSCFRIDDIQLPVEKMRFAKRDLSELFELFTHIKSEYIYARYLYYQSTNEDAVLNLVCDRHTYFATSEKLKSDFSYRCFLGQTSYKTLYSIFDKIGFFINKYWDLNIPDSKVDFSKSVTEKSKDRFILNKKLSDNTALKALFWIQKDLRNEERTFSINPNANKLANIRNTMEHRVYRTIREKPNYEFQFTECDFKESLEMNTIDLMKILKEAIIYLSIAVNEDINNTKSSS